MYLKKINLKNKTALVTGAGKGIGMACAIALAEAGANLIIISRTQKDLDKVAKIVKKFKSRCISYACDVTNYTQIKNFINKQKKIDILVNNAGTNIPEHFTKVQKKNMEYLVKLNTISTFNIAQLCTLKMLEAKKATAVATSLVWANLPSGIFFSIAFLNFLSLRNFFVIGVIIKVGQTVFTLILYLARSKAIPLVKPSNPNLVIL